MQAYERRTYDDTRSARLRFGRARTITITPGWLIFIAGFVVGAWLL